MTAYRFDALAHTTQSIVTIEAAVHKAPLFLGLVHYLGQADTIVMDRQKQFLILSTDAHLHLVGMSVFLDIGQCLLAHFPEGLFNSFGEQVDICLEGVGDVEAGTLIRSRSNTGERKLAMEARKAVMPCAATHIYYSPFRAVCARAPERLVPSKITRLAIMTVTTA
jgi:hypothetical protein